MKKIIRLTESDLTRIVRRVINEQNTNSSNNWDQKFLEQVVKYCNQKLIPLGFEYYDQHKYDFVRAYTKKDGTRMTYVEIELWIDANTKDLDIEISTGLGDYIKSVQNADITKLKSVVDEIIYLDNLMIKNFAAKTYIRNGQNIEYSPNSPDADAAEAQQEKFKKILLQKGFKPN